MNSTSSTCVHSSIAEAVSAVAWMGCIGHAADACAQPEGITASEPAIWTDVSDIAILRVGHTFKTMTDIEEGDWTERSYAPSLHDDSSHVEDDGRVYMVHAAGNLRLTQLTSGLTHVLPGGVDRVIVPNASGVAGGEVGLSFCR